MVLRDEEQRERLRKAGRSDADLYDTWEQAEKKLASFFDSYVSEMHPALDANVEPLYDYVIENLTATSASDDAFLSKPQTFNLTAELDKIFSDDAKGRTPDLSNLKKVLLALI